MKYVFVFIFWTLLCSSGLCETLDIYVEKNAETPSQLAFLKKTFQKINADYSQQFELKFVSAEQLEKGINENTVGLFFSSSAFFRQRIPSYEAQVIASISRSDAQASDRSDATLALTSIDNSEIRSVTDLKDKKVMYLPEFGFFGLYGIFDSVDAFEPLSYFLKLEKGASLSDLYSKLRNKEVDAILLPACTLEKESTNFETHSFKAISPAARASLGCLHSSRLYPGPILGSTSVVDEATLALLERALFSPADSKGNYVWKLPQPDSFVELDNLLRKLKIDALTIYKKNYFMKFVQKYWGPIFLSISLLAVLILHWFLLNHLVKKRTLQLTRLLKENEVFIKKEKENRERSELLQKIGIVGLMSSIFTHEIRQPLSALGCWVHSLKKLVEKDASKEEKLKVIRQLSLAVETAENKVELIRKISKPKGGTVTSEVNLESEIRYVLEEIRKSVDKKFEVNIHGQINQPISINPSELELILHNLIKNSIQAQAASDTVYLDFELFKDADRGGVRLSDGGPPISREAFAAMTKPFFTTKEDGMGLGLTIVKTILTKYGAVLSLGLTTKNSLAVSILFPDRK